MRYNDELVCPTCKDEMIFVGDYLVACYNPECPEYGIEYDIDGDDNWDNEGGQ